MSPVLETQELGVLKRNIENQIQLGKARKKDTVSLKRKQQDTEYYRKSANCV